jgi:hypothetical protein
MIEIYFLADQVVVLKDKDQYTLDFHFLSSRFNAGPDAELRSAEPGLHDHRIVGMMVSSFLQVEVRKGREETADQSVYRLRSIHNGPQGGDFVPGMAKRGHSCGYIVGNGFRSMCALTMASRRARIVSVAVVATGVP